MPIAKINDINLYYEVDGPADKGGDWLIFVHGGGSTHITWWRQVYALRDRYKCVTYDARGLGQSEGVEDAPSGGKDLLALMDHLKIDKAYLNGHSAGGWAVSGVAQQHPERVHGLIMTDTPFGFFTSALSKWSAEMLAKFEKGFDIRDNSLASYQAQVDPKAYFLNQTLGRLNAGVRPGDPSQYTKRFGAVYERMRDTKPGDYSKFPVPTLFTLGEVDALTLPWLIRATAKAVGGAKLVEIPRAGHGPPQEQSEIYNALLLEFLQSVDAKRRDAKAKPPKWSLVEYFHSVNGNSRA
jgi:pimeloyl-ACP methyl ester carboxylesterase